jgi:hypothetical protein
LARQAGIPSLPLFGSESKIESMVAIESMV